MAVPCGPGGCVHDYVPFYFGSSSPMLLGVVNAKNVDQYDILYFEFSIALANRPDAVFTNASANTAIPPGFFSDPADLKQLDWAVIDCLKWGNINDDFRHRRMAELLVQGRVPVTRAARCVVWNDAVKRRVEHIVNGAPFPPIDFEDWSRRRLVQEFRERGEQQHRARPRRIACIFSQACDYVENCVEEHAGTATFRNLKRLLEGLRANFGCLPHTAELVGLRSENGIHKRTVDIHTQEVVERLLTLPEYQALDDKRKMLVEIAAYLHDIGKGPRFLMGQKWRPAEGRSEPSRRCDADARRRS